MRWLKTFLQRLYTIRFNAKLRWLNILHLRYKSWLFTPGIPELSISEFILTITKLLVKYITGNYSQTPSVIRSWNMILLIKILGWAGNKNRLEQFLAINQCWACDQAAILNQTQLSQPDVYSGLLNIILIWSAAGLHANKIPGVRYNIKLAKHG